MPKIAYKQKRFQHASLVQIERANQIIEEFQSDGFTLTLRQLFYQFVSRDLIKNTQQEYKKLGNLVNDARLAGMIDWDAIEDRTRNLKSLSHWDSPSDVVSAAAQGYNRDLWENQDQRVEVWIEKDALVGVIERVCKKWDVPYFSCRGYTSQSEVWGAAMRHQRLGDVVILHLGDHDPSGIDMTRDIQERLGHVFEVDTQVRRLALNTNQVKRYNPPPNPAKSTDSRFRDYQMKYGLKCWELDALHPKVIEQLIESEILSIVDLELFNAKRAQQETEREELTLISDNYPKAVKAVSKK